MGKRRGIEEERKRRRGVRGEEGKEEGSKVGTQTRRRNLQKRDNERVSKGGRGGEGKRGKAEQVGMEKV